MNAHELYDKLAEVRDEYRKLFKDSHEPVFLEQREDVLKKLLFITFFNTKNPDNLPEDFILENVMLFQGQLEELMKRVEIEVTIKKVGSCIPNGFKYQITKTQG